VTGWAAVVLVCGGLAAECIVALLILAVDAVREGRRRKVWQNALRLAVVVTDLVEQVAVETAGVEDPTDLIASVAEHVASIDELPHDALVEIALANENKDIDHAAEMEELRTDAVSLIAEVIVQRDAEHTEVIRQTRAKRRHWSTVKRLKGTA